MNIPVVNYKPNPVMDNMIALRLLCLLTTPFNETEAYKAGLIDEKGEYIVAKSKRSKDQNQTVNYLIKFIFNVKKLLNKLPGGENKIKNLLAAMWLIKEEVARPNSQVLNESMVAAVANTVDLHAEKWQPMIEIWKHAAELRENGIPAVSADALGNPSSPAAGVKLGANPQPNGIGNVETFETILSSPVSQMWMKKRKLQKGEDIAMGDNINIHG